MPTLDVDAPRQTLRPHRAPAKGLVRQQGLVGATTSIDDGDVIGTPGEESPSLVSVQGRSHAPAPAPAPAPTPAAANVDVALANGATRLFEAAKVGMTLASSCC